MMIRDEEKPNEQPVRWNHSVIVAVPVLGTLINVMVITVGLVKGAVKVKESNEAKKRADQKVVMTGMGVTNPHGTGK